MKNSDTALSKQERKKQAKIRKAKAQKSAHIRTRILTALAVTAGVVLVGFFIFLIVDGIIASKSLRGHLQTASEGDWTKGEDGAKNVLIEYADLQCPSCKRYYPVVKDLAESGADLQIVYRHFPLTSVFKNSFAAAIASEAAGQQGFFWEMIDKLFEHQSDWAGLDDPNAAFTVYAEEIGLDIETFTADLDSREIRQKINADAAAGRDSGVSSTPSFILNGKRISNPNSLQGFLDLLK